MENLNRKEDGQGLVEYALLLTLVAVVVVGVLVVLGPQIGNVFSQITHSLNESLVNSGGPGNGGGEENPAVVLDATTLTDGLGTVSVNVTLSRDANIIVRDQASGNSDSGMCNTPCRSRLTGLAASGTIEVIAPGNSITVSYGN